MQSYVGPSGVNCGAELFVWNGASASLVYDLNAVVGTGGLTGDSSPSYLTVVGSYLYFAANQGLGAGPQLWRYDGSTTPFTLRATSSSGSVAYPVALTVWGSLLYFGCTVSSFTYVCREDPSVAIGGTSITVYDSAGPGAGADPR